MSAFDAAIGNAAAAYAALTVKTAAVASAEARGREIDRELEAMKTERVRAIELEDQDAAIRHVDGDEAVAAKPQRAKRLEALGRKIPAAVAAIPLQKARIAERERELQEARVPFTAAIMEAVVEIQLPAARRVQALIGELEQSLVDLLAADIIRDATIGDRFRVPTGQTVPFLSGGVVRALLGSLPERFRPVNFTFERLQLKARATANRAIAQIKEQKA